MARTALAGALTHPALVLVVTVGVLALVDTLTIAVFAVARPVARLTVPAHRTDVRVIPFAARRMHETVHAIGTGKGHAPRHATHTRRS